jgi:hypothetical protein
MYLLVCTEFLENRGQVKTLFRRELFAYGPHFFDNGIFPHKSFSH